MAVLAGAPSQGHGLAAVGATAVAISPGFLRSEMMLEAFGVTDLDGSRPEVWRCMADAEADPDVDPADYR